MLEKINHEIMAQMTRNKDRRQTIDKIGDRRHRDTDRGFYAARAVSQTQVRQLDPDANKKNKVTGRGVRESEGWRPINHKYPPN